jgi:hypothetical protein
MKFGSGIQCSVGITDGSDLCCMLLRLPQVTYIPIFVTVYSGIKVILRILYQGFERL